MRSMPNCPKTKRLELRIGVNLGDILVEGDDIYGDGVNVAARLERLCDARRRSDFGNGVRPGAAEARP